MDGGLGNRGVGGNRQKTGLSASVFTYGVMCIIQIKFLIFIHNSSWLNLAGTCFSSLKLKEYVK